MDDDRIKGAGLRADPTAGTEVLIYRPVAHPFYQVYGLLRAACSAWGVAALMTSTDQVRPIKGIEDDLDARQAWDDLSLVHQGTGHHARLTAMAACAIDHEFAFSYAYLCLFAH
jgi:hypothetical protein